MLNPAFNYIAFDFETTGLDIQKDEPIQIWIVQFDHEFKIIKTFQSLIKPTKPIKELKEIVRFLTGFSLQQLETAPNINQLLDQIQPFFTDKTIIVGQNISFDLAFLQKHLSFTPIAQVDTFPLAKSFLHFLPSYALDVINEQLKKTNQHWISEEKTAHDALHDSYTAMNVLKQFMTKLTHLRHHYLLLDYMIQRSDQTISLITRRTQKVFSFETKQLFFPALKKNLTTNKKAITKDLITFPKDKPHTKRDVSAWTFSKLLQKVDRAQWPYLLAFSHPSKIQLAQQQLERAWVETTRLHDQAVFDPDLINALLQQATFTDEELLFTMKYYSQYEAWHSFLDINSSGDWKIFRAITQLKPSKKWTVTLATHYQLFELAENVTSDQSVLFFDHPRRYQQFSKRTQQPFDSLQMLQLVDQLSYKYKLHSEKEAGEKLASFLDQLTIFIGVMSTEIDKVFIGYAEPKLEIEGIKNNPRFPKTSELLEQLVSSTETLLPLLTKHDSDHISQHMSKLLTYTEDLSEVEKRMYEWNKRYYLLHHANKYTGYDEFLDLLPVATYHFLSTLPGEWYTALPFPWTISDNKNASQTTLMHTTTPAQIVIQVEETQQPQFIISGAKYPSQELFNLCVTKKLQERYTIVAENITGGVGKNIFLATHSAKPVILIGGYGFYLEALAKKFDFQRIYLYHIHGAMKELIIKDLLWYAK